MSKTFSNSITIARVADGASADSIIIETSYDEILKFNTINEANEDVISFSPENFKIRIYNINNENPISNFNWALYYLNGNQEYEFIAEKTNFNSFDEAFIYELPSIDANQIQIISEGYNTLYLNCFKFYEILKNSSNFTYLKENIDNGSAFFKFIYLENNKAKAVKYFTIVNGVSNDMAKLNIGANSINMAIRESSLEFSANGLALKNGDFVISDVSGEKIFYTDDLGNLTLKGNVYAESGIFKGDVYANNGYFNGTINAFDGTIGGFSIVSNYYEATEENPNDLNDLYILLDEHPLIYKKIIKNNADNYLQITYENRKYYYQVYINSLEEGKYYRYDTNNGYVEANVYDINEKYYLPFNFIYYSEMGNLNPVYSPITGEVYYVKIDINKISTFYKNLGPRLYSSNGEIILDGTNGNIIAENIELGAGAKIIDKIIFSSDGEHITAALYNPEIYEGKVLQSANIFLNNEGRLYLGTLELYGGTGNYDGYMRSVVIDKNSQYQNGEWRINEDGTAYFNNIYADNAHIQNSILEINTVQSVGSTMIFKDSWTITTLTSNSVDGKLIYTAVLDNLANLEVDDYFMTNNNNFYQVLSIESDNNKSTITFEGNDNISKGSIITKFGKSYIYYQLTDDSEPMPGQKYYIKNEENYEPVNVNQFEEGVEYYIKNSESPDCIISIRGESSIEEAGTSFSSGNSLTISSFTRDAGINTYTKHLILGDLSDSGIDDLLDIRGYGLYADNVYLNGSLITKNLESGYCGINTLSEVQFIKKPEIDTSPIVFWGGSTTKNAEEIQKAPFQVTANGTLFCANAIIENSIFTGEIRTAKIYGTGTEEIPEPALSILDANKGISFKKTIKTITDSVEQIVESELFTIGESGFYIQGQPFINFEAGTLSESNELLPSKAIFTGELHCATLDQTSIYNELGVQFGNGGSLEQFIDVANSDVASDTISSSQLLIKFKTGSENEQENDAKETVALFERGRIRKYVKTYFDKELYKGRKSDGSYFMEYKPSFNDDNEINGYDIFIY